MRIVEHVKVGDVLSLYKEDHLSIERGNLYRQNYNLPLLKSLKWTVIRVYRSYVVGKCQKTGEEKCFTVGDLVMAGYEPSIPFNVNVFQRPKYYIGGMYGRSYN